eukprot:15346011-Ditylum_brightwellii.AAC.1
MVIKEVGEKGYTKYLCCLFKTYLTASNKEFIKVITMERCFWMMDKQGNLYNYSNFMEYTLKMYTNKEALRE